MKKIGVVINDFRSIPVISALHISLSIKNEGEIYLITSSRNLEHGGFDYGDNLPSWYKELKLRIINFFFKTIIVEKNKNEINDSKSKDAVISSLRSITKDSNANDQTHPQLTKILTNQVVGAEEIGDYIVNNKFTKIYLFNGRTARSSPILWALHTNKIEYLCYEYSLKGHSSGYVLYPYSVHAMSMVGRDLIALREKKILNGMDLEKKGQREIERKLENPFVENYKYDVKKEYKCTVFLGSNHEYTNLQPLITGMNIFGNYKLVEQSIKKYAEYGLIAVRAHPNQMNDKSAESDLAEIRNLCQKYRCDYYGPFDQVSSYSLIKKSEVIAVEYSTIALDAIYLGKKVDIFGNNDISVILDYATNKNIKTNEEIKKIVSECYSLLPDLYYKRFGILLRLIAKILAIFEYKFILISKNHDGFK